MVQEPAPRRLGRRPATGTVVLTLLATVITTVGWWTIDYLYYVVLVKSWPLRDGTGPLAWAATNWTTIWWFLPPLVLGTLAGLVLRRRGGVNAALVAIAPIALIRLWTDLRGLSAWNWRYYGLLLCVTAVTLLVGLGAGRAADHWARRRAAAPPPAVWS